MLSDQSLRNGAIHRYSSLERSERFRKMTSENKLPRGFKAVGIFLFFGSIMATFAGITLLWKGTVLDRIWLLKL